MQFVLSDPAGITQVAADQGYTVHGQASLERGVSNVLTNNTGRTFTRPSTPVKASTSDPGTVTVAGTSLLYNLTSPLKEDFNIRFMNVQVQMNTLGNDAGWDAFCRGEADVLQTTRDATDEEMAVCEENGINPYLVDFGYEGLVFAVPSGNDWVECLNAEQVAKMIGAGTDEAPPPTHWNEINPDWPERTLLLVVPPFSTGQTDYLVVTLLKDYTSELSFPVRLDMVEDDDHLYRLQGVANTAQDEANPNNGLTYVWWSDLQQSEADVKTLSVDAGDGCVAPSPETFADGTYPLSFPVRYYFSQKNFSNAMVRAFLWHFFDSSVINLLREHPFAMLDLEAMENEKRDEVVDLLAAYEEQLAAQPAATQEATEAAPEATQEATPAATEEPAATVEPTEESAPVATEEPTPVVTQEATEAAE